MTQFNDLQLRRRSHYVLGNNVTIKKEVLHMIESALMHTPSAFNSQLFRVSVLFGKAHVEFWDKTENILRQKTKKDFTNTEKKMQQFKNAYGTILFFIDETVLNHLQTNIPRYAPQFEEWSSQDIAMLQYGIWLGLTDLGLGANLQHYNPVVNNMIQEDYCKHPTWRHVGQMVFGNIVQDVSEKQFVPISEKIEIYE